jgi:hypothetical protein
MNEVMSGTVAGTSMAIVMVTSTAAGVVDSDAPVMT